MEQEEIEVLKYFIHACPTKGKHMRTKSSPGCLVPTCYLEEGGGDVKLGKASDYLNEKYKVTHYYLENEVLIFDEYDAFGAGNIVNPNVLSVKVSDILKLPSIEPEERNTTEYQPDFMGLLLQLEARVAKLEEMIGEDRNEV